MNGTKRTSMIALLLLVTVSGLGACGSTTTPSAEPPSGGPTTESAAASNGSVTETDRLAGIWENEPFSADQIDALLRDRFTDAQVDEFERTNPQEFSGYHTAVNQLHFAGDQLVVTTSRDGGTAREGWTGAYAIQDAKTFFAGGETGPLYISVNFTIDGERLILDLIRDRFPDHSPWNAGDGIHPRSISRLVDDSMQQTIIYEISSYTRVG